MRSRLTRQCALLVDDLQRPDATIEPRGDLAHWEQVRRLLMEETGVATVSHQVNLALSKDDKLDVFAFESITRARRWRAAHKVEQD
jgi:hypothetical protein